MSKPLIDQSSFAIETLIFILQPGMSSNRYTFLDKLLLIVRMYYNYRKRYIKVSHLYHHGFIFNALVN